MLFRLFAQAPQAPTPRLLSGPFGAKERRGEWGGRSHSPTGSGPEGSSPNEVRIGSLVSLLPVFPSESRWEWAVCPPYACSFPQARLERHSIADRSMTDAGAPPPEDQGGFDLGGAPDAAKPYRV